MSPRAMDGWQQEEQLRRHAALLIIIERSGIQGRKGQRNESAKEEGKVM